MLRRCLSRPRWPPTATFHAPLVRVARVPLDPFPPGVRHCSHSEIKPRPNRLGYWGSQGFGQPGYPRTTPLRVPGLDLNLQERLDLLFAEEKHKRVNKRDIGFEPKKVDKAAENRRKSIEFRKQQRANPDLERAARTRTLQVDVADVKKERLESGDVFGDIRDAGELYGVFEDLFGDGIFTPNVFLRAEFDYDEDYVTPVHRGNIIKPKEATIQPHVSFDSDPDSLWTLVLTNPDGHFTEENKEYLHWMVANIKGGDISTGITLCDYMQPFPPYGTGYHRYVFVLYKQTGEIDLSQEQRSPSPCTSLNARTFSTSDFFSSHQASLTPAGLAFFQSDWDSSLTRFFHEVLDMKEPRYEYHFVDPYSGRPWSRLYMEDFRVPFNLFLDRFRDPKDIQEELVKKKLKIHHPFKGDLEKEIKYINAHEIDGNLPQWRRREIERERLRHGYYKDLDWNQLRRDPA